MQFQFVLLEESLEWVDQILLQLELVVIHIVGCYKFAHFASAVGLQGVGVRYVDKLIRAAVNEEDWTFDLLYQINVSISVC